MAPLTKLKDLNMARENRAMITVPDFTAHKILRWRRNGTFRLTNPIAKDAKEYLTDHFSVDTAPYDVIIGYRADDSYFSFAEDFLNNAISVNKLANAMRLGNLGEQFVLVSPRAFECIRFVNAVHAPRSRYYVLKSRRDTAARKEYLQSGRKPSYAPDELYMLDIMRQEVKANDPRLR